MEQQLSDIEPRKVFEFFSVLNRIPRGSGNEKAVSDYLVEFASQRGLLAYQDDYNNVTIVKYATAGMEDKDTIILQAHLDMVCVADDGCRKDFTKDPIDAYIDGDYVKARGTSLGADDGIGIAMILAVLDSTDIEHPMIEAVFTAHEESGLAGASVYDVSHLTGKRFINLDSEEENHIVTGCAGGSICDVSLKCKNQKIEGNIYEISIGNLTGGHSGSEIGNGSANANVLMGLLLDQLRNSVEINLGTVQGGTKHNSICESASATVVVRKKHSKALEKCVKAFAESARDEYQKTDPDLTVKCKDKGKGKLEVMSTKDMTKFIALLNLLPNGVFKMSQTAPMVETSSNIAIVAARPKSFNICVSLRSNKEASLGWITSIIRSLSEAYNVQFNCHDTYPAWECDKVSDYARSAQRLYSDMFGRDIGIISIHAGLECGLFAQKIKDLDAISIGPDIHGAHTPAERLSISSTQREWKYLLELLKL